MKTLGEIVGELTLYDVLGYLFPGIPALGATMVLGWAWLRPNDPVHVIEPSLSLWIGIGLLAYFFGHTVQAVGNQTLDRVRKYRVPKELQDRAQVRAAEMLGLDAYRIQGADWRRIVDHVAILARPAQYRELYMYREGFYRGMAVSLGYLSIALLARALRGSAEFIFEGDVFRIPTAVVVFGSMLALFSAIASILRYRKFARLRAHIAVIAILLDGQMEANPSDIQK